MIKIIVLSMAFMLAVRSTLCAQSAEIQQLLLNVEKLAQFKQILTDLKKGYQILSTGYSTMKDLSEGNFNLHKTFLDGLMEVSPAVMKYKRVADIISDQLSLVKEYKNAFNRFKQDKNFDGDEINYLGNVYRNLFEQSLRNLDELATVITANKLRMSDDERLTAIDGVYNDMQEKLMFLRQFNKNTTVLAIQRARDKKDMATIKNLYGLKN